MKVWQGRFTEENAKLVDEFNSSLPFDYKLYWHDILCSIAHVKMLGECNIIPNDEAIRISDTLVDILADIEKGSLAPENSTDIHSFIETELVKRIGAIGKKIHTAKNRNDQVATDLRLYVKDSIVSICDATKILINTLVDIANENSKFYMPAFLNSRKSQPVSVAHYINSYSEMFLRDIERFTDCYKRADIMPLGSGEASGTNFPIDRRLTAKLLSFSDISQNSLDAVSDRDYIAEYLFCSSLIATHLSRFSEDLITFSSEMYKFIEIKNECSGNDSLISQESPDLIALIRGKTGRIFGNLMGMLSVVKGVPTSFNRDFQESEEYIFDTEETILSCLKIFNEIIKNVAFDTRLMRFEASNAFGAVYDVIDYLIQKGLNYKDAEAITNDIIKSCKEQGLNFEKAPLYLYQTFSTLFDEDILEVVKIKNVVENKKCLGGTSRASVRENIRSISRRLQRLFKE